MPPNVSPKRETVDLLELGAAVVVALGAFVFVFASTAHRGPGVSHDSVAYLTAARNLADGQGLATYGGNRLDDWPPLFPAAVAGVAKVAGTDVVTAARFVNALAAAGIVLVGFVLLRRHVTRRSVRIAATAFIAGVPGLYAVERFAWSEPLFILFVVLTLLAVEWCVERSTSVRMPIVAGTFAALAGMTRYAGPVLTGTAFVVLALANRPTADVRLRLRRAAIFAVVGALPPVLWAVSQHSFRRVFLNTTPSDASFGTNVRLTVETVGRWLSPVDQQLWIQFVGTILVVAAVGLAVHAIRTPGRAPLALFTGGYLLVLVLQATRVHYDPLGDRLLSPVAVPGIVLLAIGVDALMGALLARESTSLMAVPAAVVVGLLLLAPLHRTWRLGEAMSRDGAQYTSAEWRKSELAAALRRDPPPGVLYSNDATAIVFSTDLDAHGFDTVEEVRRAAERGRPVYIAWAYNDYKDADALLEQAQRELGATAVLTVADGAIYRVDPR